MKDEEQEDFSIETEDLDPEGKQASNGAGDSPDDSVVVEEYQGDTIKKLRTRLKESEAKAKEYLDGWQRAQADFVNLRKKDEEARAEFVKFAKVSLVEDLLPVLDSFNIALSQGHEEMKPVFAQFMSVLKQNGLEEQDPKGESFDPKYHEAVGTIEVDKEEEDQKVLEVVQKGYILQGKIIRPAKVRIGQIKS